MCAWWGYSWGLEVDQLGVDQLEVEQLGVNQLGVAMRLSHQKTGSATAQNGGKIHPRGNWNCQLLSNRAKWSLNGKSAPLIHLHTSEKSAATFSTSSTAHESPFPAPQFPNSPIPKIPRSPAPHSSLNHDILSQNCVARNPVLLTTFVLVLACWSARDKS